MFAKCLGVGKKEVLYMTNPPRVLRNLFRILISNYFVPKNYHQNAEFVS